jgi:hypothetical protein
VQRPGEQTRRQRQRDAQHRGHDGGHPDRAGRHRTVGDRLVGAADGPVALGVEVVVEPPDRELAGQHGGQHEQHADQVAAGGDGERGDHRGDRHGRFRVAGPQQGQRAVLDEPHTTQHVSLVGCSPAVRPAPGVR